jgi:hypothetical protein
MPEQGIVAAAAGLRTAACSAEPLTEFRTRLDAQKTDGGIALWRIFAVRSLADQHGSAVYVEDFTGDKTGVFSA